MTDSSVEAVARALHKHEWDGQPVPDNFATDREYWLSAARAAIAALPSPEREPMREALERVRDKLLGTPSVGDVIAALNIIDAALAPPTAQSEKVKCQDCGGSHDPNIRCPNYHAGMAPSTAQSGDRT